ncbi:MAG: cohesin domain-containing protein [bacterium]
MVLGCLAAVQPCAAQRDATLLEVGLMGGEPGDVVVVPVSIVPVSPVDSFELDITYDVLNLEYLGNDNTNTLLLQFTSVEIQDLAPGVIRVTADKGRGTPIQTDGVLLRLRFRISMIGTGTAVVDIFYKYGDLEAARDTEGGVMIGSVVPTPTPPRVEVTPTPTPVMMVTPTPAGIRRHPADNNQDGEIDDFELLNYINLWAFGRVPDFDLLFAIQMWACPRGYTGDSLGNWTCRP